MSVVLGRQAVDVIEYGSEQRLVPQRPGELGAVPVQLQAAGARAAARAAQHAQRAARLQQAARRAHLAHV